MRFRQTIVVLWAWLFLIQTPAWAILIETGSKLRVAGYWVSEDAKQITVRIVIPGGKAKTEVFDRSKIKIIHQVDRERLGKLSKDNPNAYRDYAEELAGNKADPEAMELALRLYLIAAYLDSPNLGRSCLLSMSTLATRPTDVRKYRAMAFLLDAKSDPALLKPGAIKDGPAIPPESNVSPKSLSDFQKALRAYQNGQLRPAKEFAVEKGVRDCFGQAGVMNQKSFIQACNDAACPKCKAAGILSCSACNGKGKVLNPFGKAFQLCQVCNGKGKQKCSSCDGSGLNQLSEEHMQAALRAEIWALDQILGDDVSPAKKGAGAGGWSRALHNQQPAMPVLTLETLTEYDPRKCAFRNGSWETP